MTTTLQANDIVISAWQRMFGKMPTDVEVQMTLAVSLGEGGYGSGWKGECANSNNWGAIQAHRPPCGPGTCLNIDTHPTSSGVSVPYEMCFKAYATPTDGAYDFLRVLYTGKRAGVLEQASRGSARGVAEEMYKTGYYEGWGATVEQRKDNYAKGILKNALRVATASGAPLLVTMGGKASVSPWSWQWAALIGGMSAVGAGGYYLWKRTGSPHFWRL